MNIACCSSDDEEAEEKCREAINRAIAVHDQNPEAFQLYASFLLVKQETDVSVFHC